MQPGREGGIGRGLANLLPHLAAEVELHLLTDAALPPVAAGLTEHALRAPLRGSSASWLQWSAPRWLRSFDGVFHCPFYGLPFRRPVPMVVTIHDLTFEHHREWFRPAAAAAFRLQARHAAAHAEVILTPSEQVRDDVVRAYAVDPMRVLIARNAVDPVFAPEASDLPGHLAVPTPYAVALGGAPRRNAGLAVSSWRRAGGPDRGVGLVVVGADDLDPEPGLVVTGRLSDANWAGLLAGAVALLYPTAYEGFGMPALEALASGTPVVCARVGALPEVLGDAAAWAAGLTEEDLAAALASVLDDAQLATALRASGLARAAGWPGWDDCAAVHLDAYRRAAAGRRGSR
jgi:glycosyltransferase involved in cell wall biosynthesis